MLLLTYLLDFGADQVSDRDVCVTELLHKFLTLRSLTRAGGTYRNSRTQSVAFSTDELPSL